MVRAVTPIPFVKARFFDRCGKPLAGGKVYTYEANTTTAKTTYKDPYGLTPNTNPIILDAAGEADIYLDGTYRIRITDRNDVLVNDVAKIGSWFSDNLQDTLDNISGAMDDAIKPMLQNLDDVINTAAAAAAGANGWTDQLIALPNGRSQRQKNSDIVSVKDFGAKGDGVTDDSDAFQAAANHGFALVPKGNYLITKSIVIDNKKSHFVGSGGVIKFKNRMAVFDVTNRGSLLVDGLIIDGSEYVAEWDASSGASVFHASSADLLSVTNSIISNVYGNGVRASTKKAHIVNNKFVSVAGNNWTADPSGAYDNYGDGIHVMGCDIALIANNDVNNEQISQSDNYLGRCGIVTEFDAKNATILGNNVVGYDRGIHCETTYDNVIANNKVDKCGTSILLSNGWRSVVQNNAFTADKKFNAGTFSDYGVLCLYGDNSGSVFINNKILISDGSGHSSAFRAVWLSGNTLIKDYQFTGNRITGGVLTNGGTNVVFDNNVFYPCALKRPVEFSGGIQFLSNRFMGGVKLTASAPSGEFSAVGNDFFGITDSPCITITNPSSSGYRVNNNRFFVGTDTTAPFIIAAYMGSNTVGELSNNSIILPSSENKNIRLLEYNESASLNKFYVVSPNLLIGGTPAARVLKEKFAHAIAYTDTVTYDPPSLATGTQQSTTVILTGARLGDIVNVSFDKTLSGTRMWAEVTSPDIVTVYHRNDTGATVDLPSGTLTVKIV